MVEVVVGTAGGGGGVNDVIVAQHARLDSVLDARHVGGQVVAVPGADGRWRESVVVADGVVRHGVAAGVEGKVTRHDEVEGHVVGAAGLKDAGDRVLGLRDGHA